MKRCVLFLAFSLALSLMLSVDRATSADDRCVLRFDRSEVNVVRGEIRIDLRSKLKRECRELDLASIWLDRATVELKDGASSPSGRSERDDRSDRRYRRGDDRTADDTVTMYRFSNGKQHRVSDDSSAGERLGYNTDEGSPFKLYRRAGNNRTAIYSCLIPSQNDHFLSTRSDCEGQTIEKQVGFVAASAERPESRALYRCYNGRRHDHLATTDQNECNAGKYKVEQTLGYLP